MTVQRLERQPLVTPPNPAEKLRFIALLVPLQTTVSRLALAAWDGETAEDIVSSLSAAREILEHVTDTTADLGYDGLRATAQHCIDCMTKHIDGPYADLAVCSGDIMWVVDTFIEACEAILRRDGPRQQLP